MSEDLIRRSDAIGAIHNYWAKRLETLPTGMSEYGEVYTDINEMDKILEHNKTLCSFIKDIPTIEPKRGKWIPVDNGHHVRCSECGRCGFASDNFCPSCGADMRGADDE